MWKFSLTAVRWVPSALLLLAMSACSQAELGDNQTDSVQAPIVTSISPTETQPSPSPAAKPSQPVPATSETPGVSPSAAAVPAQENPIQNPVGKAAPTKPATPPKSAAPSQPAAPKPAVSDSVRPTFSTTERMAGFSADGNYYLYLESSRDTGAGIPKSSLQVIDVASNACAPGSCVETRLSEAEANQALAATEKQLLQQTWKVRQDLKLTPPATGIELPIVARSRAADGTETVTVRLHNSNQPLRLRLQQKQIASTMRGGQAERDKAAMQLEVSYNGQQRSLGSLNDYRDWVLDYSIREVRLSPDGQHVAVLITTTKPTFEGTLGTTLVQGFEL